MQTRHRLRFKLTALAVLLSLAVFGCASTGPRVSKAERKAKEADFNRKFIQASERMVPKVYRVGYRLVSSHVPDLGAEKPKFGFVGVGVDDLKDDIRKVLGIDKSVKGVLVRGTYPGSKAEGLDIRPGDVIQKLDGKKVKNLGSYFKAVRKARSSTVKAGIWRKGDQIEMELPVEKVYYNAQFFLSPTPDLDANAAFSKINIGIGALRYCHNDDELAVIMGHELAHTTLKHSLKHLGIGVSSALAYGAVAGVIDAVTIGGVGNLLLRPVEEAQEAAISRRYEREADYFGMQHAFHAGFNVENGSKVFSRLAMDTPSFSLLAYTFASHPKSSERFLRLEKIIEEFKTKYPEKWQQLKNPDWEIVIPVGSGETLDEALNRLIESEKLNITTSGKDMATPASQDKSPASEYPVPKTS